MSRSMSNEKGTASPMSGPAAAAGRGTKGSAPAASPAAATRGGWIAIRAREGGAAAAARHAAGLAEAAPPSVPRPAAAEGPDMGEAVPFIRSTCYATWHLARQPRLTCSRWSRTTRCSKSIDYDLHNQISYKADRMLWGDVPGAAKVQLLPSGALLFYAGANLTT